MTPAEKRKFQRFDSLHLLDCLAVDKAGNEGEYSMGRTLDISINGIKMETIQKIPMEDSLLITLGVEDDLVNISGKPIHSTKADNRYISGIEFSKVNAEGRALLRQYIDDFQTRKAAFPQGHDFPPLNASAI